MTNAPAETICYHHLLFAWHEIIVAEGAQTESYHPGIHSLDNLDEAARDELFGIFPALRSDPSVYGPLARKAIRTSEAQVLAA